MGYTRSFPSRFIFKTCLKGRTHTVQIPNQRKKAGRQGLLTKNSAHAQKVSFFFQLRGSDQKTLNRYQLKTNLSIKRRNLYLLRKVRKGNLLVSVPVFIAVFRWIQDWKGKRGQYGN